MSASVAGGRGLALAFGVAPESNVARRRNRTRTIFFRKWGDQTQASPSSRAGRVASSASPWWWYLTHSRIAAMSCGPVVRIGMSVWTWVRTFLLRTALRWVMSVQPSPRAAAADDVLPGPQ